MVLEVEANTGEIHKWLDTSLAELLGITNTRALEDQWRAESATANDNELPSLEVFVFVLART